MRLPASFTPDGGDEAGQMIAVSRQRRQTRTTHKPQNTCKATVRQRQISTSLPLQDGDMQQSQLLSAHTHSHTHQTGCKRTHTRSHPVRQISQLHSTTLPQQSFSIVVFRGYCLKPREDRQAEKEDGGKKTQVLSRALRKILSSLYSMVSIRRAFDIR